MGWPTRSYASRASFHEASLAPQADGCSSSHLLPLHGPTSITGVYNGLDGDRRSVIAPSGTQAFVLSTNAP